MLNENEPGPELYPLLLRPELHRRVWGGEKLAPLYGEGVPVRGKPGEPVGESWLLDGASVVTNGPLAGRTLAELAVELGSRLVGSEPFARYGARLPLLLKLLDADQPLSVQVHPDDRYALAHEAASGHLGKSEAWYVLEAAAGASVLWGLESPLTPAELERAAATGELPGLMQALPVAKGSVVVNPAGTLHAVGAGILLFEIQQSSDLTYRIYDYGRVGADGQPRELHLTKAAAVADLTSAPHEPPAPVALADGWQRLVQRPEFVLDRLVVAGP
ncbi:MAG: type I phosphomannose isomerase catalytic subunit, partial [Trueperaceae bacterium]